MMVDAPGFLQLVSTIRSTPWLRKVSQLALSAAALASTGKRSAGPAVAAFRREATDQAPRDPF
jgi:hypothetical protein